ncbi:MAG: Membrane protein insertase YidC [Bacteroidetes bacterium ADurb.Bin174]|nr:MAG: Membrane protein insertase YidC [Bacteroidetes bacterium ADurb.Bin174]
MDKNTILGFVLIAAILITFSILNRPSQEEIERQRAYQDSLRIAQQELQEAIRESNAQKVSDFDAAEHIDSSEQETSKAYGDFKSAASGEEKLFVLENDLIKITLSNKGGRIVSAQLKEHLSRNSLPVELFHQDDANFGFTMALRNNHIITTSSLFFNPVSEVTEDSEGNRQMTFRLQSETNAYIDFVYTLPANDYMLDFTVRSHEMNTIMPLGSNYMIVNWNSRIRQQEKGRQFEERYSTLNYKYLTDDMEKMNAAKDDEKKLTGKVKWIAFKDQYFSSILIAGESFSNTHLISKIESKESGYMKSYQAEMTVDYNPASNEDMSFKFYLGPNKYKTLASYDKDLPSDQKLKLREVLPLGWGIFGWINRFAIIPMFNFFSSFISNFGIIILLMTIVIKLVLFPLTYKSYVSSAKMRVLKPEIDEINERIPPEKAAERQKATMELYNKVGVSPFSGCLPTLLQMPILFAMFMFFPSSIELRGESFLWAKDLSSYDAIVSWDVYIPFISKYYGNHISLFTLLMTITTLISTKLNMANTNTSDQPGSGMMKWMMYLMPIMFMFIFNSYASGLSYYYFISTLITIGQTYAIRSTIDEEKLLAELHAKRTANAKKQPTKKKSSFMERLEKMQREQEKLMRERSKKR